jgi:1-acyl-sn-glycerol-3-phosphate acyltransferase
MHTLYYYLMFWIYQIYLLPWRLGYLYLKSRGDTDGMLELAHQRAQNWSNFLLHRTGCSIEIVDQKYVPKDQAVLFVSNHQGEFDIPLLLATIERRMGFIAKKELAAVPLMGWWMTTVGCVFINRDDRRASLEAAKESIAKLQSGHSLVVFPEGTRSDCAEMAEFKKGSLNLATRAGVSILPIAIKDTFKIKNKNQFNIHKAHVRVTFFPPIDTGNLTNEEKENLTEKVQGIIQTGLD